MRIRIDADPIGPLEILRELPDARLAILEGLNGIGKTLAVRLLEICVRGSPYPAGSPAWASLCRGLGEFSVTIDGLKGNHRISWSGDSRTWLGDDASTGLSFTAIQVDGAASSLEDVRTLFGVYRLGGEEGIVDTLAREAEALAETVHRWTRRYADQTSGPLVDLEHLVDTSLQVLGEWSTASYEELVKKVEVAHLDWAACGKEVEALRRKRDDLTTTLSTYARLREIRLRSPDLVEQLRGVDERIERVQGEREIVQERVQRLAGQVAAAQPAWKELGNARKTVDRNRRDLTMCLSIAASAGAALGVEPSAAAVSSFVMELDSALDALRKERTALDAAPAMRKLLDQIIWELRDARVQGLGDQIALDELVNQVQLTVDEVHDGMTNQREFLEGKPPPPEAERVTQLFEESTRRLSRARSLAGTLAEVDRFRNLVARNEQRVASALNKINPNARVEMEQLEAQRRQKDDELLELAAQRAALKDQLGGLGDAVTEAALAEQLRSLLERLQVAEADLEGAVQAAEEGLQNALVEQAATQQREVDARRELQGARAEIRKAVSALAERDELGWVRRLINTPLPADTASPVQQLEVVGSARERVQAVNERVGELRGQLGAMESALQGAGRGLRGLDPEARRYLPEVQAWLGHRFSDWFNLPRVRAELLPTADGEVEVDLAAREVRWQEGGITLSRPLEAFSSGEQAFAYTRARLAVLDEEQAKPTNRLIVLDEFGAFIAHDRLAGLLSYLREREDGYPDDQVLMILPLTRDYAELSKTALPSDSDRLERLASEIASRKYAVQVLG